MTLVISGQPGIGKTSLFRALLAAGLSPSTSVIMSHGYEFYNIETPGHLLHETELPTPNIHLRMEPRGRGLVLNVTCTPPLGGDRVDSILTAKSILGYAAQAFLDQYGDDLK